MSLKFKIEFKLKINYFCYLDCIDDTILWIESPIKKRKRKYYSCKDGIEMLATYNEKTKLEICLLYGDMCCKTCNGNINNYNRILIKIANYTLFN